MAPLALMDNTGAVYLVNFSNSDFASPSLTTTLQHGNSGFTSVLDNYDEAGKSVSLSADGSKISRWCALR